MTVQFYEVERGFLISDGIHFIFGSGAPGGSGDPDVVGIGSFYADTATGSHYRKKTAGTGADKWDKLADQTDLDALATGTTWREPVLVKDDTSYANLAAAETAVNTATIDGVTVAEFDRILFTNITGSNANAYEIAGTVGAGATLVEDTAPPLDGFTLWVQDGTDADTLWAYSGTAWVQRGSGDQTELGFIRTFIGKTAAGSETPTYTSNNVVTDGDNLEVAIGKLDAASTGTQTNNLGVAGGVTTIADSFLVDDIGSVTWHIRMQETVSGNTEYRELTAMHDGHGANDAAVVQDAVHTKLKAGVVAGIATTAVLNGAGGAQEMRLVIDASNNYDVRVFRASAISLT